MKKLFERTPEQVEEEQTLLAESRKIEQRKKERDRKTQDLQKLITAADHQADPRKNEKRPVKKSNTSSRSRPTKSDAAYVNKILFIYFFFLFNLQNGAQLRKKNLNLLFFV